MSPDDSTNASQAEAEYAQVWASAASRVLEQLHGPALTATSLPEPAVPAADPPAGRVWICWKVAGKITGEQSFHLAPADAVRLSQLLMQEPANTSAALDDAHSDALKELFRQFAGMAATACKAKYGQEVSFDLSGTDKPDWVPAHQEPWVFASPQLPPIQWTICLSSELLDSLNSAPASKPAVTAAPPPATTPAAAQSAKSLTAAANLSKPNDLAAPAAPAVSSSGPGASATNLDMLLDVGLEAILRFGQREMLLRDILELRPGSVIELNRNISEPAELLVGGRVIARGDVVIVDGNYGLRITEIEHPRKRLESIET